MDIFLRCSARQSRDDAQLISRLSARLIQANLTSSTLFALELAGEIVLGIKEGNLIVGSFEDDSIKPSGPWIDTSCISTSTLLQLLDIIDDFFIYPHQKSASNLDGWKPTRESVVIYRRIS